jgi:hypothetical protein
VTKKINILTLVLSEKKILNETKFFRKKPNCEIVQAFIDEIDSWLLSNGVSIPFTMQFFLFGDTSKSNLFVPRICWLILYCNHCSLVFCVTIKGSLNISLHFVSSKPKAKN